MQLSKIPRDIVAALHSQRGHNILVFMVFLLIATILWWVMALNDSDQCDVRMPLRLSNVPDTVTVITAVPPSVAISLQTRGSQLLKLNMGRVPTLNIDFRAYKTGNTVRLTAADLKSLARSALDGADIIVVSPDTLSLTFTTNRGIRVPVRPDVVATPGPQSTIVGRPSCSPDTISLYTAGHGTTATSVQTEPLRMSGLNETTTRRLAVLAPAGCRAIPDSVDVTIDIEPLIFKTRKVRIETSHVPPGRKLILFPAQVDVRYMVPVSIYKKTEPRLRVVADYRDIDRSASMMPLRLTDVPERLQNVQLATDSVEYIIETL